VCAALGNGQDLQVVGEASDGLEAVQKAVELKPDLVLMDIGLPCLNGIEAARRIRELVPEAKILFLSQETSAEVIQEALSLGTSGYVVKVNAGIDLLPAIEAVISGRQFVSGR
jgi:DNA-binding NarL/FixJ family response regulator